VASRRPPTIRRIGILTGGGDAPGLNAVIRAATLAAIERGWEVLGLRDGFAGLLLRTRPRVMDRAAVRGIAHLGGTVLGTTNQLDPLRAPGPKGSTRDRGGEVIARARALRLDAVIAIGGDGTLRIAHALARRGLRVMGVPKTIDNDVPATAVTFGFDTAVGTAMEAIDKLHPTAEAHRRVMVVEVMGRDCGWIALNAGIAGAAHVILRPEIPFAIDAIVAKIRARERAGRPSTIVVVAEGASPVGGSQRHQEAPIPADTRARRLGGIAEWLAPELEARTGKSSRALVLGHLQRGGSPTPFDRLLATRFGAAAVRFLAAGRTDAMVALRPPSIAAVPLARVVGRVRRVPRTHDAILAARAMGICFGDEAPAVAANGRRRSRA
jgi:6-phosphofructokinase 1